MKDRPLWHVILVRPLWLCQLLHLCSCWWPLYNTQVDVGLKAMSFFQAAPGILKGRGQQVWCRPTPTSSRSMLQVASGVGVCLPEASSKWMASPLPYSSLTPVCAETQTYHLTALPWRLCSTQPSVDAHTRMSVFDAVSGFYFGRWPHSSVDHLKRIHFTCCVLSAPLNFQPNWAYRSISCGFPQTCLLCVCVCVVASARVRLPVYNTRRGMHTNTQGNVIVSSIREAFFQPTAHL